MRPIGSLHVFPSLKKLVDLAQRRKLPQCCGFGDQSEFVTKIHELIGTPVFAISMHSENIQGEGVYPDRLCDLIVVDEIE